LKNFWIIFLSFLAVFFIDRNLKELFLSGWEWHSKCISLNLTFNKGVAFSLFENLGEYLKYIQTIVLIGLIWYFYKEKELINKYSLFLGLILGGAISNLYDRFIFGAVVDYIYWHCYFDFAIFNFADISIDIGIAGIFINYLKKNKKSLKI